MASGHNRAVFSCEEDVYLVGGYLRDLINRGTHSKDRDFVVRKRLKAVVFDVSKKLGGRLVELRKERILRLVLKTGHTLDFSLFSGDIVSELARRDFAFNAMSWSPKLGFIDPFGGLEGIKGGVVKGISERNFKDDPLRLLRAYRFAAENSWRIDPGTRRLVKRLCVFLKRPASERITSELYKLLNCVDPFPALRAAIEDNILMQIIYLNNNDLKRNIKVIYKLNLKPYKTLHINYFKEFSQGLTRLGLMRLEGLLLGAGTEGCRMSLSRDIYKRVDLVERLYDKFLSADLGDKGLAFDLFYEAGSSAKDLLVLTGKTRSMVDLKRFERISRKGLISAEQIMAVTGLKPGPHLGRIIHEARRLQYEGLLKRKQGEVRGPLRQA